MKVFFSLLASLLLLFPLAAQPAFEPGFFINQSGARISCQILISQQEQTPQQFRYRLDEADAPQIGTLDQVQAFGVTGKSLFQRATVDIETSPRNTNELSTDQNLALTNKQVFLETLIEAEVSLLTYRGTGVENFYVKQGEDSPTLLGYKRYKAGSQVKEHAPFRQILFAQYSCPGSSPEEIGEMAYKDRALIKHVQAYLECQQMAYETLLDRPKSQFNLTIRPGIRFAQFQINHESISWQEERAYQEAPTVASIGVQLEWLPPLKNQRWALTLEPTFQSTQIESQAASEIREYEIAVSYQSIEILAGITYFQSISPRMQLFANAGLGFDALFGSDFLESGGPLNTYGVLTRASENYFGGLGLTFNDRFSLETRYAFGKDVFLPFAFWSSQYNYFTAILGVRIF